jgi:hypothetical protein
MTAATREARMAYREAEEDKLGPLGKSFFHNDVTVKQRRTEDEARQHEEQKIRTKEVTC